MNKKIKKASFVVALAVGILFFPCYGAGRVHSEAVDEKTASTLERISGEAVRVITAVPGETRDRAIVRAYEKTENVWLLRLEAAGYFGKNGVMADRLEGSEATPSGSYTFGRAFGVADDPGSVLPYTKVTEDDVWVDDPKSRYYNMWASKTAADADWNSAEQLAKHPEEYKYVLSVNYNTDPVVPGKGSAIFLHSSIGKPTAGCVSVPDEAMIFFLAFVDENTKIVISDSPLY